MWYALFKAALSGLIVLTASDAARRSPALGALIAALPIVSVLAMIWLWKDTHDPERVAAYAGTTFWLVLPSLPMFLVLPSLLRAGMGFYIAIILSCLMTALLYLAMTSTLKHFGINF